MIARCGAALPTAAEPGAVDPGCVGAEVDACPVAGLTVGDGLDVVAAWLFCGGFTG